MLSYILNYLWYSVIGAIAIWIVFSGAAWLVEKIKNILLNILYG
jgi:hypothetical protein